jgi:hypothetical protein
LAGRLGQPGVGILEDAKLVTTTSRAFVSPHVIIAFFAVLPDRLTQRTLMLVHGFYPNHCP